MSKALENARTLRELSTTSDPGNGGFWPDVTPTAAIQRARDRVFTGGGAAFTGNRFGTQGGFVPTSTQGANWAPRDSTLFVAQDIGLLAVTGFVSNANMADTGPNASIGVSGFVINSKAGATAWGLYSDIQHESTAQNSYGLEVAAKNKGGNYTATPYALSQGVYGLWIVGGGDNTYGGSAANPSNAAIVVKENATTWNTGLVFEDDALTGTDGVTGTATAIHMARGHTIRWANANQTNAAYIRSDVTTNGTTVGIVFNDNNISCFNTNGASIFSILTDTTAATSNFIRVRAKATGTAPVVEAAGNDTNIDLTLTAKGTGVVQFGVFTANADAPVTGYVTIKDSSGNTRKLATIA